MAPNRQWFFALKNQNHVSYDEAYEPDSWSIEEFNDLEDVALLAKDADFEDELNEVQEVQCICAVNLKVC